MLRTRALLVFAAFALLVNAGCGDDDPEPGAVTTTAPTDTTATTETTLAPLTDSFRGVTADTIKVGFVMVDYDCIAQFIDFNRGDQQAIAQTFIDNVNENGGVLGRSIEPVFKTYCPLGSEEPLQICTSLTEDEEVFAVLGVFIDFSGDAQLCLTRDHETIHIGHELRQEWIDQAPPALLLSPDITAERRVNVLMNLVGEEGTLDGKTVAVLADQTTQGAVDGVINPALDELGVDTGSTAVLTIEGPDTSAALAQLDSFIERWGTENVDTVVMAGLQVSAKQFVEKLRTAMPDVLLLTDAPSGAGGAAQDAVTAGQVPNPYEGIISADGETASERFESESVQDCVDIYESASGQTVVGPDDLVAGEDGKRAEVYIAVNDFCGELKMFTQIAERVGADLTNDSWTETVNTFGAIELVGSDIASLSEGKYDADDAFRLIAFDSTIPPDGDWLPLTEIADASGA